MRTISSHLTALDRQAAESVNILEAARKPEESLNQKSEWGGAKIPALLVTSPKGIVNVSCRTEIDEQQERAQEILNKAGRRGLKRLSYLGEDKDVEVDLQSQLEDKGEPGNVLHHSGNAAKRPRVKENWRI